MRLLNDKIRALIRILFPRRGSLTRDRRPLCHLHNYTFPFPADAFPRLYVRRTAATSLCAYARANADARLRRVCARIYACVKCNARGSLRVWWRHARRGGLKPLRRCDGTVSGGGSCGSFGFRVWKGVEGDRSVEGSGPPSA